MKTSQSKKPTFQFGEMLLFSVDDGSGVPVVFIRKEGRKAVVVHEEATRISYVPLEYLKEFEKE